MLKRKSIDYIFGMITGASLMVAFWACTNTPLGASGSTVQEVKVVNATWEPVYVERVDDWYLLAENVLAVNQRML